MDRLVGILKAAGEPTRLRLLAVLARGELTVSELTYVLGQSQPRISRHLKLLVDAGLLERKPEGAWVFYRLVSDGEGTGDGRTPEARLTGTISALIDRDEPVLKRDFERLEAVKADRAKEAAAYFRSVAPRWNEIRSLHVAEAEVEAAILALVGGRRRAFCVDLGTGTGRMLELLSPVFARGEGIDASREMLALARTNLDHAGLRNCQVRYGDIFSLPYANGFASPLGAGSGVDLVVLHQVLHFLSDPAAAIAEAARIIAPGGELLIVDFAPHTIEHLREAHQHRRLGFAEGEVAAWCAAAGLAVEKTVHLNSNAGADPSGARLTVSLWRARAPELVGRLRDLERTP